MRFSANRNVSCPHLNILVSYPYYASTVTNHTHGLQNKMKLLPHNFFSCLNIFSVFFWRKTDVFRLWERKFSWYLFPQQSLAAFRTQVPIVKPLILQRTGLQRPCYLIGLKKQGDVALKGQLPCHTINDSTYAELFWEDKKDFAAADCFQVASQFSLKQAGAPLATPPHVPKNGPTGWLS